MNKLESEIDNIQRFANACIGREYRVLCYSFSAKLEHLNEEQAKKSVDVDLIKITDELMMLVRQNSILHSLADYVDGSNFLWDSTFIETLTADEKKKYTKFNSALLDISSFTDNSTIYDAELPYFSSVIKYAVLIRYINYLKKIVALEQLQQPVILEGSEIEPQKIERKLDFESKFENWQIDILTECINNVKIFSKPVTAQTMSNVFSCKLKEPLQVAKYKNKLLAYFFSSLDNRALITRDWQVVCSKNRLFLSSAKGIILQQGHLSSAVSQNNEFLPKDCHIIDNYIKKLKRD